MPQKFLQFQAGISFTIFRTRRKHFFSIFFFLKELPKEKEEKMEPVGTFLDEEWESLSRMFSSEDSDFMLHFHLFSNQVINGLSFLTQTEENVAAGVEDSVFFPSDTLDSTTNFFYVSQESSNSSTEIDNVLFPGQEFFSNFPDRVISDTYDNCSDNHVMEDKLGSGKIGNADIDDSGKTMQFKRKSDTPEQNMEENSSESPKKKYRVSRDVSRMNSTLFKFSSYVFISSLMD